MSFEILHKTVIKKGLCTYCGTCVGVCASDNIFIENLSKNPIPQSRNKCNKCSLCVHACPSREVSFPQLSNLVFGKSHVGGIGNFRKIVVAHASDVGIRNKGTSGGVVTALLINALKKGLVSGAVITTMNPEKPWQPKVMIAKTEEEIKNAAQSKYVISPTNSILKETRSHKGDLALVGLPCQVQAIRKLQQQKSPLVKNIKYVLGLMCRNTMYFDATKELLDGFGVKDYNEIKKLGYREGKYPGGFKVNLKSGKTYQVIKDDFMYLFLKYMPERCRLCLDHINLFSDITFADPYFFMDEELKNIDKTWTATIIRTETGSELVDSAVKNKAIMYKDVKQKNVLRWQKDMENKDRTMLNYLSLRKRMLKQIPDYGLELPKVRHSVVAYNVLKELILRYGTRIVPRKYIYKIYNYFKKAKSF